MLRRLSFQRVTALSFCAGLTLGYEAHLHSVLFPKLNVLVIALFTFLFLLRSKGTVFRPAFIPLGVFAAATVYALATCVLRPGPVDSGGVAKLLAQFAVFLLTLTVFSRDLTEEVVDCVRVIAVALAVLDLPLLFSDSFLLWETEHSRAASILYDPNYAGVIFGFGLIATMIKPRGSRLLRAGTVTLLGVALLFTFSKGAIIALLVALVFSAALRWPVALVVLFVPGLYLIMVTLNRSLDYLGNLIPLLRIDAGLNLRDVYWSEAYAGILQHPFLGHRIADMFAITTSRGYEHSSIHNYYLESAFLHGVPYTLAIVLLLAISVWRSVKTVPFAASLAVLLAVAANNVTFSLGGVGLLPMVFALLVAYPFQRVRRAAEQPCPVPAVAVLQPAVAAPP